MNQAAIDFKAEQFDRAQRRQGYLIRQLEPHSRFCELRPYDGEWTWLAPDVYHATVFDLPTAQRLVEHLQARGEDGDRVVIIPDPMGRHPQELRRAASAQERA